MNRILKIAILLFTLLFLYGCDKKEDDNTVVTMEEPQISSEEVPKADNNKGIEIYKNEALGLEIYDNSGTTIDASEKGKGYIMVRQQEVKGRVKLQIIFNDITYNYDLPADNKYYAFPIQMGNGKYTVRTLENIGGSSYSILYSVDIDIEMENEFNTYLYPNQIVNYNEKMKSVKKVREICNGIDNDDAKIEAIYKYVTENIQYDYEKAYNVENGYISNADKTFTERKGICVDYAVIMAVMLRTENIPTQVIYGSSDEAQWHAWNKIFKDGKWELYDATFAAGGAVGHNYVESYKY